ncbi:hypothetical protein Avbf_03338 [Armadillidium vulgare]|nr:hypothetical protein Avbf_03338 [Armadillidium vulgare]
MEDATSTSEEYEIIGSDSSSPTLVTNMATSACDVEVDHTSKENKNENQAGKVPSKASTPSEPMLKIANNGNLEDLKNELQEVLKEKSSSPSPTNSDQEKGNFVHNSKQESHISLQSIRPSFNQENDSELNTGKDNPNYHNLPRTDIDFGH